jgi:hypothetical protein
MFSLFRRSKRNKSLQVVFISMLAGLSFIAMAIIGWDLPVEKAASFLFVCVALLFVLILAAFVLVAAINGIKRLFK